MSNSDCPDREQLQALSAGMSDEGTEESLLAHVENCSHCRTALNQLLAPVAVVGPLSAVDVKAILEDPAFQGAVEKIEQFDSRPVLLSGSSFGGKRVSRDLVGETVGQYAVLEKLGEGGMGVVYQAYDSRLKRLVALKITRAASTDNEATARFRSEAETIARLRHPNIVQIYEVGEHEGIPYFALELVDGGSLSKHAKGDPLPPREAAGIVAALGHAIDYAHQQGVVHRDLKPGNILISARRDGDGHRTETQPTVPSGPGVSNATQSLTTSNTSRVVPRITDFGLAKNLISDSDWTRSGAVMGTPSFMAPEQARGETHEVGPASDIYSLGAILYALLTGRPPFLGENYVRTISMVTDDDPIPPTRLLPRIPRDLETICLKCLEKLPAKRYSTAGELADDLQRYLRGEPILARPTGTIERIAKLVRRRPAVATVVALIFAILVIGLPSMTALYFNSEFHRREAVASRADEARAKADAQRQERNTRKQVARLHAAEGVRLMNDGQLFESMVWTASALEEEKRLREETLQSDSRAEKIQRFRLAATLQQCPAQIAEWSVLETSSAEALSRDFFFSPDGKHLGLRRPNRFLRWSALDGKAAPIQPETETPVICRHVTRDGQLDVALCEDLRIRIRETETGQALHELTIPREELEIADALVRENCILAVSPDHKTLVASLDSAQIIWDLSTGKQKWAGNGRVRSDIQFAQGGQRVLLSQSMLWDRESNTVETLPVIQEHTIFPGQISPDARCIAHVYLHHPQHSAQPPRLPDGTIEIQDLETREFQSLSPRHNAPLTVVRFDPTAQSLMVGHRDGIVQVWDASTWTLRQEFNHRGGKWDPQFSPDGRWIALSQNRTSVRIWDIESGQPVTPALPHTDAVHSTAWGPDGHRLAVLGTHGDVRIWDLAHQSGPLTLNHDAPLITVRFSHDDKLIATGCADHSARIWNAATGQPVGSPMSHDHPVIWLSWDGQNEQLATIIGRNTFGRHGNAVQIWNVESSQPLTNAFGRELGGGFGVGLAKFSPAANQLVIQYAGAALILDLDEAQDVGAFGHPGPAATMFGEMHHSSNGRKLLTVKGPSVCVWEMPSGKLLKLHEFTTAPGTLATHDIAVSPDSQFFAIATERGLYLLASPEVPEDIRTIIDARDVGNISVVNFDRTSQRLVSVDVNGACRIWDVNSAQPVGRRWDAGGPVRFAGFGATNHWVVTVLTSGEIQLWDAETGAALGPRRQHGSFVNDVTLSRDGSLLATAGIDGAVRLWNLNIDVSRLPNTMPQLIESLADQKLTDESLTSLSHDDRQALDRIHLRREFPEMFEVAEQDILNWHRRQAADSANRGQSAAASFHLSRSHSDD